MQISIITIPFDKEEQLFDFDPLNKFCLNKDVLDIQAAFFSSDGRPYWSFTIIYKVILEKKRSSSSMLKAGLSKEERALFERLRTWRSEKAHKLGQPPFVIANDKQLCEVIKSRAKSKTELQAIKGFGSKKIANHGDEIIEIIQTFFEHE